MKNHTFDDFPAHLYSFKYVAGEGGELTLSTLRKFIREKLNIPPEKEFILKFPIKSFLGKTAFFADVESDETDLTAILLSPTSLGRVVVEIL